MTNHKRIIFRSRRSDGRLLAEGVSSLELSPRMTLSRKRCAEGSIAGDWRVVGRDIKRSIRDVKREFETA